MNQFDNDSVSPIGGIQVRKLRRGTNKKDLEDRFKKYNPLQVLVQIDNTDPRFDFAFIMIHDREDVENAIRENNGTDFNGHIINVQLNFENNLTLEEFLDLLESNRIYPQGGLIKKEVDDPNSSLAIAFIMDQDSMPLSLWQIWTIG
ncbi:MAG: hypothetical protein EZS28_015514 [Streblomastix strix]|uniref:RRM domain-containing protein n=1 Tax=Streblomastix strix TaxID=222440 RepID=A0A5J4W2C4_9EUKA|nr:MAG: hypothetical protein EZS28_015514 [Streblomastix strix]